ncbi:DUF4179 domain-containing protein [Paenibacillus sp. YYML68]|uniref:DUF4179 domain-containing protein n=1 Tax=Paenibacillus sp. YYML68 TaxID=2909250 RepID=UPI002490B17B|nr:DUF4179 domain-containing protein [Paenibacillus sp. YYML68]
MSNSIEELLLKKARAERPRLPDFEAMWEKLQAEQQQETLSSGHRRKRVSRRLLLPAIVAAAMLVAAPVVAGVSMGWTELFGRIGVKTAVEGGFGSPLDIKISSAGTTLSLHGVVTDDQTLDVLFTMQLPSLPAYDVMEFEHKTLTTSSGTTLPLDDLIQRKPSTQSAESGESGHELTGLLEARYGLGKKREQLGLSLRDLVFLRYSEVQLPAAPASLQDHDELHSGTRFGELRIVSVFREKDVYTIRYEVPVTQEDQRLDPRLSLKSEGQAMSSYSAVLPSEQEGVSLRQDTYRLTDEELSRAKLHFSYLEKVHTIAGTWETSFTADGRRASQATYRKKLDAALVDPETTMKPMELVVTPLHIRVLLENESHSPNRAYLHYDNVELLLNGQTLSGGLWHTEESGWSYRFESPEWSKDWSHVPMTLQLSEAWVSNRANEMWFPLQDVSESKQTIETSLDGFPVTLTYYQQGQDLIVESHSDNAQFRGISQTAVKRDGKAVYPAENPMPPGGNGSNRRADRYPGLLAEQGTLQLSPGFYSYSVPEKLVRVPIN